MADTGTDSMFSTRHSRSFADVFAVEGELVELLAPVVAGGDEQLQAAARTVATWAAFTPRRDSNIDPPLLCVRGLVQGHAYELEWLATDADSMERRAAALRTLIGHVEATNSLARRRRARAAV